MILLLLLAAALPAAALDLARATIAQPGAPTAREKKAAAMLAEEIFARSQVRLGTGDSGLSITLTNARRGAADGYRIRTSTRGVAIEGNDERGVLFGVGHLLRKLTLERGKVELAPDLNVETAPTTPLRGHQLGYRPKTNSYDGWDLRQWEQYIRDLAVFGTNAIELIPPRSDDAADSPHFPLSQIETMIGMSRIADEYGIDVWIWYPALDPDYAEQRWVDFALKEWEEVFRKLPRIDAVFVPGGDPGHTHPKHLMPLLEKQAASLRKHHPKAQMWVAPQGFSTEWLAEFQKILAGEPQWLNGVVFGPQIRVSLAELRRQTPKRYPIRLYPDITHSLRAQYAVRDWDPAYQVTLQREPINPRPEAMRDIFLATRPHTVGFITYSEGCNDDVNKFVWSGLGWDQNAAPIDILRDYSRYFIGARLGEGFAQSLAGLERNWEGPLMANEGVYRTLQQLQSLDRAATPAQHQNWRLQQAMYRGFYDAHVRARLLYETALEQEALEHLRGAWKTGSLTAVRLAEETLERAVTEGTARGWRMRVFELAEALFQSIKMQLSAEWYGAINVGRGANLDLIDTPLNDRLWLQSRFAAIRAMPEEPARRAAIADILGRANPGPGGFYDDLGNPGAQPHLTGVRPYREDPDHLASPLQAAAAPSAHMPRAWSNWAESRNDEPIELEYRNLEPGGRYRVRYVQSGEKSSFEFRLVANGAEVHGWQPKAYPPAPVEFDLPPGAVRDGTLRLRWERKPGYGGNGRSVQLAEVWLLRK